MISDKRIIMLMGPPASGKSSYAAEHANGSPVITTDDYFPRAADGRRYWTDKGQTYYWDESFVPEPILAAAMRDLLSRVRVACECGVQTVFVEDVFLDLKARLPVLELARRFGYRVEGVCFELPLSELARRNDARAQHDPPNRVPDRVLAGLFCLFEPPRLIEGFAVLTVIPNRDEIPEASCE